jgi:hypothetical protein
MGTCYATEQNALCTSRTYAPNPDTKKPKEICLCVMS